MWGAVLFLLGVMVLCFIGVYFPAGFLILLAIGIIWSFTGRKTGRQEEKTGPSGGREDRMPSSTPPPEIVEAEDEEDEVEIAGQEILKRETGKKETQKKPAKEAKSAADLPTQKRLVDAVLAKCLDEKTQVFDMETYEEEADVLDSLDREGEAYLEERMREIAISQVYFLNNRLLKPAIHSTAIRQLPGALKMEPYKSMRMTIPFLCGGGDADACPDAIGRYAALLKAMANEKRECTDEAVQEALTLTAEGVVYEKGIEAGL